MDRTQFAGLTSLAPGEPLATDGYSFQTRNPQITDALLKVGAVTHKHDGHVALSRPTTAASAVAVASGGTFPADAALMVGYTITDSQGGETLISDVISVTTPPLMPSPSAPPSAAVDYSGGSMRIDTYYYVKTWVDYGGGETTQSPYAQVVRAPGFASGQVQFHNLASGMATVGAAGWKLYKAGSDGRFKFLASGATDTFTDDGTVCTDCVTPPPQTNTTQQRNRLDVTVPAVLPSGAQTFRIYVGLGGGFFSPSLMGEYPLASAGIAISYASYVPFNGRPPDVPTAISGANQINPDTDILDWHWKRPVATQSALGSGSIGDVRLTQDTRRLWTPASAAASASSGWTEVPGNVLVVASGSGAPIKADVLVLGTGLTVTQSGASAIVTASGGSGGGGGGSTGPDAWQAITFNAGFPHWRSITDSGTYAAWRDTTLAPPAAGVCKGGGIVYLRGGVEVYGIGLSGIAFSGPGGNMIFQLPVGYRPDTLQHFTVPYYQRRDSRGGTVIGFWWWVTLVIDTDGKGYVVSNRGHNNYFDGSTYFFWNGEMELDDQFSLEGISFRAA